MIGATKELPPLPSREGTHSEDVITIYDSPSLIVVIPTTPEAMSHYASGLLPAYQYPPPPQVVTLVAPSQAEWFIKGYESAFAKNFSYHEGAPVLFIKREGGKSVDAQLAWVDLVSASRSAHYRIEWESVDERLLDESVKRSDERLYRPDLKQSIEHAVSSYGPLHDRTAQAHISVTLGCSAFIDYSTRHVQELFKEGVLNCWTQVPDALRQWCNADLTNSTFRDVDFSGFDLRYADFSGSTLERVKFGGSRLEAMVFRGTRLKDVTFPRDWTSSDFTDADFSDGDWSESGLPLGAVYTRAKFDNSNMRGVIFSTNHATGASFRGGDLIDATFSLRGVPSKGICIEGAILGSLASSRHPRERMSLDRLLGTPVILE